MNELKKNYEKTYGLNKIKN